MPNVTLQYRAPSALDASSTTPKLALSAALGGLNQPFFQGQVRQPRLTARALTCLSRAVGERWFDAAALAEARRRMLDPIVTSGDSLLRFEGFSGCRSLYVRVDLLPGAVDVVHQSAGATNVDFNQAMRSALTHIRSQDAMSLSVDEMAFTLIHGDEALVEHKVDLPISWLRGLASIPVISSRSESVCELNGRQTLELFRQLPRTGNGRDSHWLQLGPRGARIGRVPSPDAIQLTGAKRLLVLQELLPAVKRLSISTTPERNLTLWTLHFDDLRLTLALSPEVWRGFSGEGAALDDLARESDPDLDQALLDQFESGFDAEDAAIQLNVSLPAARTSLASLASQGQLGFDHLDQRWFRRLLPAHQALIQKSNPRLAKAESWLRAGAVRVESHSPDRSRGEIQIDEKTSHHVAIDAGAGRCTCFWFGKFGLSRGPCSHILALQLATRVSQ
ncbi:SWIM zinc finger family protein [Haloferula chungangensis]|uniref:SWIM zinc finger family protein n=1 Tax=Haloferula chungangensis TaxID=1048331 RepID=A0ABW2L4P9_9BACT